MRTAANMGVLGNIVAMNCGFMEIIIICTDFYSRPLFLAAGIIYVSETEAPSKRPITNRGNAIGDYN